MGYACARQRLSGTDYAVIGIRLNAYHYPRQTVVGMLSKPDFDRLSPNSPTRNYNALPICLDDLLIPAQKSRLTLIAERRRPH
jgi:hypothetical protein